MLTKKVDTITELLLSKEIAKYRNALAFERFVDYQASNSKQNFEEIIEDKTFIANISLNSKSSNVSSLENYKENTNIKDVSVNNTAFIKFDNPDSNLQTLKLEDGTIVTKEYTLVPFIFVQSETVLKPDGTKIYTVFYPSNECIPAKRIMYSSKSMVTTTTHFDIKGNIKSELRVAKYQDCTTVEENIDAVHHRKTKKYFNKNHIATIVESYVNDNLVFRLESDDEGNTKRELTYNGFSKVPILTKEVVYYSRYGFTVKEYNTKGELYSCYTKSLKRA